MASSASTVLVGSVHPHATSTANLLLAVMGGAERWLRDGTATVVELGRGETIARRSERVDDVFFPESAVLGVISRVPDGRLLQTLSIGREGSSAAVSLIDERSVSDIVVQLPGRALRISTEAFATEIAASPAFASAVRLHARRLFEEAQTDIACVNFHHIRSRVANWLLTNAERFDFQPLPVSHEMLSQILGVRRPTISEVSSELSRAGWVEYSRNSARVVDADGLRDACCACYRPAVAIREEYVRLHREMLGETRSLPHMARATVAHNDLAARHNAYAAAVRVLADYLDDVGEVPAARINHLAARELAAFEGTLKAYVRTLHDSGQSPERTLALIKSSLEAWRLSPVARDLVGQLALRWMIDEYYAASTNTPSNMTCT